MTTPPQLIRTVGGLLVNPAGEILFGLRAPWKTAWPNHWDAVGGRIEPGETLEQALVREIREEVGVTPTRFQLLETVQGTKPELYGPSEHSLFAVTAWTGGEPANVCDEHSEIRWFALDALSTLPGLAGEGYPALAQRAVQLWRATPCL